MSDLRAASWGVVFALMACGGTFPSTDLPNAAPRARLAAPLYAPVGEPVVFDAGGSYDPDGAIVSYTFSFSDGDGQASLPLGEVQHTFAQAGAFEVAVVVRDDGGLLSRATQLVVVRADPPSCAVASDCTLGAECRPDVKLCYATGPGVASGEAECQDNTGCSDGATCRAGICLSGDSQPVP
jgi:hypothetical protein